VSSPVPGPPMISVEAAARALCELFLANADRGDNAANDHLIAEMVGRIRTQQESRDGDRGQQPPIPRPAPPQPAAMTMADRLDTIPIACCVDGQAHEVTDQIADR
jgi:hypothetical protein